MGFARAGCGWRWRRRWRHLLRRRSLLGGRLGGLLGRSLLLGNHICRRDRAAVTRAVVSTEPWAWRERRRWVQVVRWEWRRRRWCRVCFCVPHLCTWQHTHRHQTGFTPRLLAAWLRPARLCEDTACKKCKFYTPPPKHLHTSSPGRRSCSYAAGQQQLSSSPRDELDGAAR